jgi:hypothetical protein
LTGVAALLAASLAPCHPASAKTWAVPVGDWHTDDNWSPSGVPAAGEDVVISVTNAVVSLTNETALVGSFTMTAGRLVFSNWTTRLVATNITLSGGTVTVANAFAETDTLHRVWMVCTNDFVLTAPGRIDVTGGGYRAFNGPGKGTPISGSYGGGGGHGGRGGMGQWNGGPVCDSLIEPVIPGSGGGYTNFGGTGGGAGGAICLVAGSFTGNTNGLLQADGGRPGNHNGGDGGGGYGGFGGKGASAVGGTTNGNPYAPVSPGSGGGVNTSGDRSQGAGFGGGVVLVDADGEVRINGQIRAGGNRGTGSASYSGAGSGGAILIRCQTLTGTTNAVISADGGDRGHDLTGGGGGGRVAVWHGSRMPDSVVVRLMNGELPGSVLVTDQPSAFEGAVSATNGINGSKTPLATTGTVVFLRYVPVNTVLSIR